MGVAVLVVWADVSVAVCECDGLLVALDHLCYLPTHLPPFTSFMSHFLASHILLSPSAVSVSLFALRLLGGMVVCCVLHVIVAADCCRVGERSGVLTGCGSFLCMDSAASLTYKSQQFYLLLCVSRSSKLDLLLFSSTAARQLIQSREAA